MILPDNPIQKKEDDKLHRYPLALKVAELIENFKSIEKESFVIGIEGEWGSGKTSFISLVTKELKPEYNIVINFNPWNFSGQNELISDFFATLASKIDEFKKDSVKAKKIKSVVSKLTRKSEVAFSPEISVWGVAIKTNDLFKLGAEKTLDEERKEIDDLFRSLNKKIVIVIDDIDRLDTEETRLIMKLVKMTANFPNTIFLLAYDREKVAQKLEKGETGEEYLKKIIQVSFTLPKPDRQGLNNILFSDLDETIKGVYGELNLQGENEKRWGEISYAGFTNLFHTVRDIKRYISSLRLNWSIIGKDDINLVDFMTIEVIRVFAPHFYSEISSNQVLFTNIRNLYAGFNRVDDVAARQSDYKELLEEKVPKEIRNIIDDICKALFPQLNNSVYGDGSVQTWKRDLRICSEKFPFYFQLGIPEGHISESEIGNLIKTLKNKDDFSQNLLTFAKEKRIRTILSELLDKIETLAEDQIKNLLLSLWNLENQIDDERVGVFEFDDVETQTNRISFHSTKKLPKEKRLTILKDLLAKSSTLYYPGHFVAILNDMDKKNDTAEDLLLTSDEVRELVQLMLKKIKSAAKSGALVVEKRLAFFLFRWRDWENPEVVKDYIANVLTQEGLVYILKAFVGKVLSTAGNYNTFDKEGLGKLYPISEIEEKVSRMTTAEIQALDEKGKEAVNLFKEPKKRGML